jgi:hypothetical protein
MPTCLLRRDKTQGTLTCPLICSRLKGKSSQVFAGLKAHPNGCRQTLFRRAIRPLVMVEGPPLLDHDLGLAYAGKPLSV